MRKQKGGVKLLAPVEDLDPNLVQILKHKGIQYQISIVSPDMIRKINRMQPWSKWLSFMKDYENSGILELSPAMIKDSKVYDMAQLIDHVLADVESKRYDRRTNNVTQTELRRQIASRFVQNFEKSSTSRLESLVNTKAVMDVVVDYVVSRLNECL